MPENAKTTKIQDDSPSMEDILQSIRGVISGEEELEAKDNATSLHQKNAAHNQDDDILELTNRVDKTELSIVEKKPQSQKITSTADINANAANKKIEQNNQIKNKISILEKIDKTISANNDNGRNDINIRIKHKDTKSSYTSKPSTQSHNSKTTLETLVVEALKPEISEWLNNNLADIVREVTEKEINKLIAQQKD